MRHENKNISAIGELIENLKQDLSDINGAVWFRGQSNHSWKLEPKLLRSDPIPSESHLLNRFKQNATFILDRRPNSDFEWMFLMQHYALPTRLLDWTESPLVGLYFAVQSASDADASLWILLPSILNEANYYKPDYENEIPSFEDEHLQNYRPEVIANERSSRLLPMAAIAPRNSSRMQAQQGVFTISHRENVYLEDVGCSEGSKHIWRYIIPKEHKIALMQELSLLGYSKFKLFPELENLSEQIMGI